jgi:hypothetical protein
MLQSSMGGQNAILRFNNSSRYLRSRVDREFELGHLAIVNREALKEHGAKTRSSIVISSHFLSYNKLSDSVMEDRQFPYQQCIDHEHCH